MVYIWYTTYVYHGRKSVDGYQVLENITQDLFSEVEVDTLEIDRETGKITVTGYSAMRESLLAIKETLEKSPDYKDIDFPLSNLTDPKDIDFSFNFIYEY